MTTIAVTFQDSEGTLVALATRGHRTVAAIVHPSREVDAWPGTATNWSLAGDLLDTDRRPKGTHPSRSEACAEAAKALGHELGVNVAWQVER